MLSGLVPVRNGRVLDYCWKESVFSLIPVVDELVICDADSDDGTSESIAELVKMDSRIRSINYPWPNPVNDPGFWVKWLNWARGHLKGDMMIQLDADEVLDPASYDQVRSLAKNKKCALFKRLNFWRDAQHTAPHNHVCGTMVARLGPSNLYLPSDEPIPAVAPNLRTYAEEYPDLQIFHYGFLRHPSAFVKKTREVQNMFFGSTDQRVIDMEAEGRRWDERDYFSGMPLGHYDGHHPEVARQWLRERNYKV
jgi:glycosyltransferase involved in cell wall biosynthesis